MDKKKKITFIVLTVLLAFVAMNVCGFAIYLSIFYHADEAVLPYLESDDVVEARYVESEDYYLFKPKNIESKAALIFYPGAKVEYISYAYLMHEYAKMGITCMVCHMAGNMAFMEINAADGIQEQFPEIETWVIGGHSLGGAMASKYLSKHPSEYDGIIFYGSYPNADLSGLDIKCVSIYGSEDTVTNKKHFEDNKKNLPKNAIIHVIEGGNHAQFGMYGEQGKDGVPKITVEEQVAETIAVTAQVFNL